MAEGKFISVTPILRHYGQLIIDALKKNLEIVIPPKKFNSMSYGVLWQSIDFSVTIFSNTYTMSIEMENYWRWVEFGRKAGKFPPIDSMIKWTLGRGFSMEEVAARDRERRGIKTQRKPINRESVRRSLAFRTGRKIAKFGTTPTHFASKVLGADFIQSGALTAPIFVNMRNDLIAAIGKEVTIQVINFNR